MNKSAWHRCADSTFELWDEFIWVLAKRLCQSFGRDSKETSEDHIRNPAEYNDPCDLCYSQLSDLLDPDLCHAIGILGSCAYRLGREGVGDDEAAHRALREMVDYLVRKEESKKLLAQVGGETAWWKLPLERDEDWLCGEQPPNEDGLPK